MKIAGKRTRNNNNFTVNKNVIIAVAAVLVVVALVVGLIVLLPSKKEEGAKPTTTTKKDAPITGISIEQLPNKTEYFIGEELDCTGLIVRVKRNDGTSKTIDANDPNLSFSKLDSTIVHEATITATYKDGNKKFTADFSVNVKGNSATVNVEGTVTEIAVLSTPKSYYIVGDTFDPSAIIVKVTVAEGDAYIVSGEHAELVVTGFDSSIPNDELVLTVSFREVSTTYTVAIKDPSYAEYVILGLSVVNKPKTEYGVGQEFDPTGLKIQVITDKQDTTFFVDDLSQFTFAGFDSSKAAENQVITITYEGVSTVFTVTIKDEPKPTVLVSIKVLNMIDTYTKQNYDRFGLDLTGASLELTYSDDTTEVIKLLDRHIITLPDAQAPGELEVVVAYEGKTTTVTITITE